MSGFSIHFSRFFFLYLYVVRLRAGGEDLVLHQVVQSFTVLAGEDSDRLVRL